MSTSPLRYGVLLALTALGCAQSMDRLAGSPTAVDAADLPGTTEWSDLPDPADILATSQYLPPQLPCRACHDNQEVDETPRELTKMHGEIVFDHDEEHRWCLGCHNPRPRDQLRLADGKLIGFEQHPLLCGQCHGTVFRDWKVGIHGKRTGEWNGDKRYWMCAECHDPHKPAFQGMTPEPPPPRLRAGGAEPVAATTPAH